MQNSRKLHRLGSYLRRHLGLFIVAFGLVLVGYALVNHYYYDRALRPEVVQSVQSTPSPEPIPRSRPIHIVIPGLIDQPLEQQRYRDGRWTVSEDKGSYLAQSAKPGGPGNTILYGHNRQEVFGRLTKVTGGEPIIITTEDGRERRYRIEWFRKVNQSEVQVLAPTDTEVLTIYTCAGWLDAERFVVRAVPESA